MLDIAHMTAIFALLEITTLDLGLVVMRFHLLHPTLPPLPVFAVFRNPLRSRSLRNAMESNLSC